jgi:BirA family transcriptional regulator, biotin operon repressor / biotin---[acetyl-CoA-carboxylase] ligase
MSAEREHEPLPSWEGRDAFHWRRMWNAGDVLFFDETASTNDVAASLAAAGAPDFSVVVAERQTRGRGRGGSSWADAPGKSLLFSVLIRTTESGSGAGCAPIRAGMAVASAIPGARVKWPNDVVIPGHGKVAGILCEGVFGSHIVAGIGVNVLQSREDFPQELRAQACSVLSATGRASERSALLTEILRALRDYAPRITQPLSAGELAMFERLDVLRDREVVCDAGSGERVAGVVRGAAEDGALLIATADTIRPIYNGTVRLADHQTYPGTT